MEMDERKMEAHRIWRRRLQLDLDVFALAVENDDVGVGVHAMTDIALLGDDLGHHILAMMFGRQKVVKMMLRTLADSDGGDPRLEMQTEDHQRWYRAMEERGAWETCENEEHQHGG